MLEVKDGRWFGRLDADSPKVKWMRRVYPRVDYTQERWTVAGTVDCCYAEAAELKYPHFEGGIDISPAAPHSVYFRGLLSLLATQQKWYHRLQQVVQSLIPHNYKKHWCTQQTACSTHTHPYCNLIVYVRSTTVPQSVFV